MNTGLKKLICQTIGEPPDDNLPHGAISKFARVFANHSGKAVSRASVSNWVRHGMPANKIGIAEELAKKYAPNKKERVTARDLRPDLYGEKK